MRTKLSGFLLFLLFFIFLLYSPQGSAVSESSWISSPLALDKISELGFGVLPPYSINGNRDCDDRKVITRPKKGLQTEQSHISCVVDANYGAVSSSGYLQRQGTTVSGETRLFNGPAALLVPIPLSSTAVRMFGNPLFGNFVQFIPAFQQTLKSSATVTGAITHTTTLVSPVNLKDKSGQLLFVNSDSLAFSPNGHWMVVDAPNIGMIRVNLATFEVLPFGDRFNYNIGVGTGIQSAISSDGRYAVLASRSFGRFKLYDLSTCGAVPNFIAGKVACQSRDLYTYMQGQLPGFDYVSTLRFIHSGALKLYATYKDAGNVARTAQFVLRLPDVQASNFEYLALGDSFASGEGAYQYKALTDTKDNKCHLSLRSYPYLIAQSLSLHTYESVACSGAKIVDIEGWEKYNEKDAPAKGKENDFFNSEIYNGFLPGYRAQSGFLERRQPNIITVSTVGNDIGFGTKIKRCMGPDTCYANYEDRLELVREINSQFYRLTQMYKQIKDASDPRTKIYILGYPKLAKPDGNCAANVRFNQQELIFANDLVSYLNLVIKQAADYTGVAYVSVEDAFNGYRMCETDSWNVAVNGLTAGNDVIELFGGPIGNESYHPNAFGHQLFKEQILDETSNFTLPMPQPNPSASPPADDDLVLLNAPKANRQVRQINFEDGIGEDIVHRDEVEEVTSPRPLLKPTSSFDVWLNSNPVRLGTFTSDASGNLAFSFTIPNSVPTGFHTLHIYGQNVIGEPLDIYKTVYVAESENDLDGDGIANHQDPCVVIEPAGFDTDKDGTDDACDGFIGQPPLVVELPGETQPAYSGPESNATQPATPTASETLQPAAVTTNLPQPQVAGETTPVFLQDETAPKSPQAYLDEQDKNGALALLFISLPLIGFLVYLLSHIRK